MAKVLVIGLDCADPKLVFERFKGELPNLERLIESSLHGNMKTCIPAITIPAWMAMATGKDPGVLGVYGFRQRKGNAYNEMQLSHAKMIKEKRIWERFGGKSILVGVPPTYPVSRINGTVVSCFLTPDITSDYTYPKELKTEILDVLGGKDYIFDVIFRSDDRDRVLKEIYEMTERRFMVIEHLMKKQWDLLWFVEIGTDRIHHCFWKYSDPEHPKYKKGNKYENAILDYYKYVDKKIGKLLENIDDYTYVLVVSDHGVKHMKGAFSINDWLVNEGYLVLKENAILGMKIREADVDWDRTKAWAWEGYYARIYLNVKGREPKGIVQKKDYEKLRNELIGKFKSITGPKGERWKTRAYKPEEIYEKTNGSPPDLMVYLDNLGWRAVGTMGYPSPYLTENDTGPDDAMHDENGMYILYKKGIEKKRKDISIYDIAPTLLKILGGDRKGLTGKVIV